MMTGAEVGKTLLPLLGLEREKKIIEIFQAQGLSPACTTFRRISSTLKVGTQINKLEMDVSCVPAALGDADDYLLIPAWPWTYQTMADQLDCVLPSKQICTLVAQQADFRVPPITESPNTENTDLYIKAGETFLKDLKGSALYKPGMLVVSPKKDVVVGPDLDGKWVAIFGWFNQPGPQTDTVAGRIQPYSTVHDSKYGPDYSHSWRIVRAKGFLNGKPVLLTDVAQDAVLHPLVSDQGPFPLHFPSATRGTSTATKALTGAGTIGGAVGGAVAGGLVGGPVGAAVGALIGAALGRHS